MLKVAPRAPQGLSRRARGFWRQVITPDSTGQSLVQAEVALRAFDRAEACATVIARDGLTTTTRRSGALHRHPLLDVERDARRDFRAAWGQVETPDSIPRAVVVSKWLGVVATIREAVEGDLSDAGADVELVEAAVAAIDRSVGE